MAEVGLEGLEDLRWWLPARYEDRRNPAPLASVAEGQWASVRGTILAIGGRPSRSGMHLSEAILSDGSGNLHAIWFNQPWIEKGFPPGTEVFAFGKVSLFSTRAGTRLQIESPELERVDADGEGGAHADRIVPVYRALAKMHPRQIRAMFLHIAEHARADEVLPAALVEGESLQARGTAFSGVHFPSSDASIEALNGRTTPSHRRLIFEELLGLQWTLARAREWRATLEGVVMEKAPETGAFLRSILPFHLTGAQRRAVREIFDDLAAPFPMYRLLHGDVGSGKTVVAFVAMAACAHQGFQAAFMAPTEVLALQQYQKLDELLKGTPLRSVFLASSVKGKARREAISGLASGEIQLAVGTHSLFQEKVEYARLGLVVIDEQHRFGVEQRARLVAKGQNPNVLVMTATPIPRSLAMTLFGDLDLSVLDELPPGRKPVVTALRDEGSRHRVEAFLRKEMDAGKQVFVVYPLIEESEALDVQAATAGFARLQAGAFKGYSAALLHGRMTPAQKESVVRRVREGEVKLLVATTVVEVGIDLPEASAMVVEHAERFGLAQLHQLRGRVGRGGQRGYCILMHAPRAAPEAIERLKVLETLKDGFSVADADLALRGSGDPGGTRQWGSGGFRIANPLRDFDMLEKARDWARRLAAPGFRWAPGEEERFRGWAAKIESHWGSYGRIG